MPTIKLTERAVEKLKAPTASGGLLLKRVVPQQPHHSHHAVGGGVPGGRASLGHGIRNRTVAYLDHLRCDLVDWLGQPRGEVKLDKVLTV